MWAAVVIRQSQSELAAIAVVLCLACIGGAVFARTRAPAVTVALTTGFTTGVLTFFLTSRDDPHGVPLAVVMSASAALTVSGLFALAFFRVYSPARTLRRAAAVIVACAPVVGLLALLSLQHACPLYVTRGAAYCYYDDDVLGGWSAAVAIIISLDLLVIAFLVWLSARQSEGDDVTDQSADEFARSLL
jgi:Kef-type K+ transport system membrane component KefB